MRRALTAFGLGFLGFLAGTAGILIAKSDHLASLAPGVSESLALRDGVNACIREADTDDIFYISCGGIY